MHKQVSGWTVNFGSKFWECPTLRTVEYHPPPKLKFREILELWVLTWQSNPPHPHPENWNLGKSWNFEFWLGRVPPWKLKFRQILELWVLTWQSTPPPPGNLNLGKSWNFEFWLGRVPPPPPPPENWNLGKSWNFEFWLGRVPPWKLKFRQILELWVLTWQSTSPPENWNLGRSWNFEFWLGRVPPPLPPTPKIEI